MRKQSVPITIDKKTGKMTIEGVGFLGKQCDILKNIEQSLGVVTTTKDKPERYQHIQHDYVPVQTSI